MRTENHKQRLPNAYDTFAGLIERVRARDVQACDTLVQEYGGAILREARLRLGSQYASYLGAEDVMQSVLRSFFLGARDGKFTLASPTCLVRLLCTMARNKARTALRRESKRKSIVNLEDIENFVSPCEPCDGVVSRWELMGICRKRMGSDDWQLLQLRLDGYTWREIAERRGESAEALRKRLRRALDELRSDVLNY
ncbi:MAG: sigma-70 family RNA polymerase sigma factor [Planctomycetales bacterium]|nr:sigma-70 family RNA polymerase sigma factor [Planctomycetales bacterium]MCA9167679.1 sigma-70 family RNA polymerase sigma factor [Planctomycetales bacterium]